jgi:hypothetical protein
VYMSTIAGVVSPWTVWSTAHLVVFQKPAGDPMEKNVLQPTHCNQNFLLSVSVTTMLVVFHHFAREVQVCTISVCLNASRHEPYMRLLNLSPQGSRAFVYWSLYRVGTALKCALSSDCAAMCPVCAIYAPFCVTQFTRISTALSCIRLQAYISAENLGRICAMCA